MGTEERNIFPDSSGNEDTELQKNQNLEGMRKQKQDTVFRKLYSDPERAFDLYKSLNGEYCRRFSADDVKIITLENIILARKYNDVAFQIGNRLIVLVEHQSTINQNMPFRMLLYVAAEYEKIIRAMEEGVL